MQRRGGNGKGRRRNDEGKIGSSKLHFGENGGRRDEEEGKLPMLREE